MIFFFEKKISRSIEIGGGGTKPAIYLIFEMWLYPYIAPFAGVLQKFSQDLFFWIFFHFSFLFSFSLYKRKKKKEAPQVPGEKKMPRRRRRQYFFFDFFFEKQLCKILEILGIFAFFFNYGFYWKSFF